MTGRSRRSVCLALALAGCGSRPERSTAADLDRELAVAVTAANATAGGLGIRIALYREADAALGRAWPNARPADPRLVDAVIAFACCEGDRDDRSAMINSLEQAPFAHRVTPLYLRLLCRDPDRRTRIMAGGALTRLRPSVDDAPALLDLARPGVCIEAHAGEVAAWLISIGPASVPAALGGLRDADWQVRYESLVALDAFGRLGSVECARLLVDEQARVREAAVTACAAR
jgi:hypothetical protein